ncbi:MAG: ADP-glyceromanno-heptose 6-epimerase [Rhodospirillaceae bacterium]|nr:ADP-glyceromanno-heptose 6-epimerase [Rhodospirillaceae bacterium]
MIIVTGGAGFIGSNLLAGLEGRGHGDLALVDWLGTEDKWRNVAKRGLAAIIRPPDLMGFLARHGIGVTAIFHLGAISATTETDGDRIADLNIMSSLDLWDWCTIHGVRLIYASSAATYGDGSAGFDDDPSAEALARLRPLNLYGWSKHVVDRRVLKLAQAGHHPPQWAALKFFNVYGPNEYHKGDMRSVVARLYPQLAAGEPARLFKSYRPDYPDGGQMRDFVHVDDCVDVMLWLFDHPEVSGLFNLGTGAARTWVDLATAMFAAMGRDPVIDFIDMPESLRAKYQYFTQATMGRLHAAGYSRPFTSLEDGVGRYVRDYLAAPDPYR